MIFSPTIFRNVKSEPKMLSYHMFKMLSTKVVASTPAVSIPAAVSVPIVKDVETPGRYYQYLVHKGRQKNLLGLADLRRLLERCQTEDHAKYAVKGVEYYQLKGNDFSEEINSIFIKACIRANKPRMAADQILVFKNRIGAWTTVTALNRLLTSLLANGEEAEILVNVITMVIFKGIKINLDTIELALKSCIEKNDYESYVRVQAIAEKGAVSNAQWQSLQSNYPIPEPKLKIAAESIEVPVTKVEEAVAEKEEEKVKL